MNKSTEDILNFENFCPFCKNYRSETGACSKIHKNIKDYPNTFYRKCSGHYFIQKENSLIVSDTLLQKIKETYPRKKRRIGCGTLILLVTIGTFIQQRQNIFNDFKEDWAFAMGEIATVIILIFIGVKFIRGKVIK